MLLVQLSKFFEYHCLNSHSFAFHGSHSFVHSLICVQSTSSVPDNSLHSPYETSWSPKWNTTKFQGMDENREEKKKEQGKNKYPKVRAKIDEWASTGGKMQLCASTQSKPKCNKPPKTQAVTECEQDQNKEPANQGLQDPPVSQVVLITSVTTIVGRVNDKHVLCKMLGNQRFLFPPGQEGYYPRPPKAQAWALIVSPTQRSLADLHEGQ